MKIIAPPQINHLDELLDVVLHPDKLATALQQLTDMRNAITEQIGIHNTVDLAKQYLVEAQAKAVAISNAAREISTAAQQRADATASAVAQLQNDQDAWTKAKVQEQDALKLRQTEADERSTSLLKWQADLETRESVVAEEKATLAGLRAKLMDETAKMEQRKAVLNAI